MQLQKIKADIGTYLFKELNATLSDEKTIITDLKKGPAVFLGFEIYSYQHKKFMKIKRSVICTNIHGKKSKCKKLVLSKVAGQKLVCAPDRQSLIERLHFKGYCDKKGFPIAIPWLAYLEPFTIIEKFNSFPPTGGKCEVLLIIMRDLFTTKQNSEGGFT